MRFWESNRLPDSGVMIQTAKAALVATCTLAAATYVHLSFRLRRGAIAGRSSLFLALFLAAASGFAQLTPEQTQEIIRHSAQATHTDWERAPDFDFCEVDTTKTGSRTSAVLMIAGSPYYRLVQVNGEDLSPDKDAAEQQRLTSTIQQRQRETPEEKAKRIAKYQKERNRDRQLLEQFADAMNFTFSGHEVVDSHQVEVFEATPRADYVPKRMETKVLTGLKGKLWIDESSFRWVKVQAEAVKPVSIVGFLARVEPGTELELQERPINAEDWLPRHFRMHARARILFLVNKSSETNESYFNYQLNGKLSIDSCKRKNATEDQ